MLAERGVEVDHVTVYRWVQRFTSPFADATRPCRHAAGYRALKGAGFFGSQAVEAARRAHIEALGGNPSGGSDKVRQAHFVQFATEAI
jgi:hypothetical protein